MFSSILQSILENYTQDDPRWMGPAVIIAPDGAAGDFPPCWALRARLSMLIAALWSRSIVSPHWAHRKTRYSSGLPWLTDPHPEQVMDVYLGLGTVQPSALARYALVVFGHLIRGSHFPDAPRTQFALRTPVLIALNHGCSQNKGLFRQPGRLLPASPGRPPGRPASATLPGWTARPVMRCCPPTPTCTARLSASSLPRSRRAGLPLH